MMKLNMKTIKLAVEEHDIQSCSFFLFFFFFLSKFSILKTTKKKIPIVLLFDSEETGYFVAACVFAVMGVLVTLYCALNIKEHVKVDRKVHERVHLGTAFKSILKNSPL